MADLIAKARQQWRAIGAKVEKNSITPAEVNAAAQATLNAMANTTPYIGANGNWWIGGADTGKSSKGDKGDTGAQGVQGEKGDPDNSGDFEVFKNAYESAEKEVNTG